MSSRQPFDLRQITIGALAGAALTAGIYYAARNRTRTRTARHLSTDVSIYRNALGVPVIVAGSRSDALFGLGAAMAEDRLWQMDMTRRAATGRLSEVTGEEDLQSDRLMRLLGMPRIAHQLAADMDDDTRTAVQSFAAGVNHQIEHGRLPLEFRVTRHEPEPWTVADSVALFRLLAWSLGGWHQVDLAAERVRSVLGDAWADAIYSGSHTEDPPIVRESTQAYSGDPATAPRIPLFPSWGTSNAWAVSGDRSVTGSPLLANDPHLEYSVPSIWYEAALDAPGFRVSGVTISGFPGIGIGRTPTLAWGLTAGMIAQTFLYRERLSDDGTRYADGDGWRPLELHDEVISIRGRAPEVLRVRATRRGPLISDIEPGQHGGGAASLYWSGMEPSSELRSLLLINGASTVDEVIANRGAFGVPAFNMAAADSDGNIAMIGLGKTPVREPHTGLLDRDQFPPKYVPDDDVPLEVNPARGWVACANNRTVGDDYPYPIHGIWSRGYRCRRITEDLEARRRHSTADMRALQLDRRSLHATELTPVVLDVITGQVPDWAVNELREWDYQMEPESRAALLFSVFHWIWTWNALGHQLRGSDLESVITSSRTPSIPGRFVDRLLRGELPAWFDEHTRRMTVIRSFHEALRWIEERLGTDPATWAWGSVNRLTFEHPFVRVPGPHRQRLTIGPYSAGGDRNTVNAALWFADAPFEIKAGPTMRFVTDLRRYGRSWVTNTLGENGSPLSHHFRDQIPDYLEGNVHRLQPDGEDPRSTVIIRAGRQ